MLRVLWRTGALTSRSSSPRSRTVAIPSVALSCRSSLEEGVVIRSTYRSQTPLLPYLFRGQLPSQGVPSMG